MEDPAAAGVEATPPTPDARPRPGVAAVCGIAALMIGAVYWTTLDWLAGRWRTDPFYSHGPLIPIVSAGLLWMRRRELRLRPAGMLPALLLVGAALLYLLGVRLKFEFLSAVSILVIFGGLALLAGGTRLLRTVAFPLLYLLFAIPLPRVILEKVSLPLQLFSSACAESVFTGLGAPVNRQGVLLIFPSFTLAVADACSGLRSLITVLAISTLAAYLAPASRLRRFLLISIGSAAALLANIARITLAGFIGISVDGDTACVFFERYSGFVFFALVILAMVAAFGLLSQEPRGLAPPAEAPSPPVKPGLLAKTVLVPLLLILITAAGAAQALKASRPPASSQLGGWQPRLGDWRVEDVGHPAAPAGEEWVTGTLRDPNDRVARFSVIHSVSGRYLHSPEACSIASGWIPERQQVREFAAPGGAPLSIHLWILRRGAERVCLVFWFDLAGTPARGSMDQHIGAVWQRLKRGEIDSAYGEIVLPLLRGTLAPEEGPLLDLARALHREMSVRLWPKR
jgi:exosortase